MSEEIMVCPACDSPMIHANVQTNIQGTGAATAYRCRNCPATFDEPATRERRSTGGRAGLAGTLADEDTELALDGGQPAVTGSELLQYIANREQDLDLRAAVLQAIDERADDRGAPVGDVIEAAVADYEPAHLMDACLAVYALAQNGEIYAPSQTTLRTVDHEPRAETNPLPDGGHRLDDPLGPDPGDPAQWCRECGRERAGMCACCGSPLCPDHLDRGAGTCSTHVTIDTRVGPVPACIRTVAGEREVCVDAPTFNHARPQRARLPPDEIERAVRERLPDALIERAAAATTDARARLDDSTDPAVIETLLAVDDALRFALAADDPDRRDGWLDRAVGGLANCLAGLDDEQAGIAMDLTTATATLEQLGIAADAGGETDE